MFEDDESSNEFAPAEIDPSYPDWSQRGSKTACGCCCGCLRLRTPFWARRVLRNWHVVAACVQGASFIAQVVLFAIYYTQFLNAQVIGYAGRGAFEVLYTYKPAWLILAFTLLTTLSHVIQALTADHPAMLALLQNGRGANWIRWGEYAVTASFMTVVIAETASVRDLLLLIVLVLMNVVMQLLGGLHEERHRGPQWLAAPFGTHQGDSFYYLPTERAQWLYHILAWLLFVASWTIIFWYFIAAATTLCAGQTLPWFVWAVFIVLLVQYLLFGIVQLITSLAEQRHLKSSLKHLRRLGGHGGPKGLTWAEVHEKAGSGYPTKPGLARRLGDRRVIELMYITLSLVAKLSLEWIVFAGLVDFAVSGAATSARNNIYGPC